MGAEFKLKTIISRNEHIVILLYLTVAFFLVNMYYKLILTSLFWNAIGISIDLKLLCQNETVYYIILVLM